LAAVQVTVVGASVSVVRLLVTGLGSFASVMVAVHP
jgi:hypothetical protein